MAKKEFIVKFHKDANSAWCGSAYFINDVLGEKYVVSVSAMPMGKKTTSVGLIKERLEEYEVKMRTRHFAWRRVNEEEFDKFLTKQQKTSGVGPKVKL